MMDLSQAGMAYNRFDNLDSIEDRIIYYLLSPTNKNARELEQVHNIWRLLVYNSDDALSLPLPKYSEVVKLIANDNDHESNFRIFRSPRLSDAWVSKCSLLKIYINEISPTDHINALINIGIDVVVNSNIINVNIPEGQQELIDIVDGVEMRVETKSRVSMLVKSILYLLNGADVAGVGRLIFTKKNSITNRAEYGLWNNRNFEGVKIVMGVMMGAVS